MSEVILRAALNAMTHIDGSEDNVADAEILAARVRSMAREALARADQGTEIPMQPTEAMLNAARDWSVKKYGHVIGTEVATGCWQAMLAAFTGPQ